MLNMIKRSFDKLVKITGFGTLKGLRAENLVVGDEILEKSGEVVEVIGRDFTPTRISIKLETKNKLTGAYQKRTVRRETVFALIDQDSLESKNKAILRDINGLSEGTMASLTGFDQYQTIDKIRAEFYDWTEVFEYCFDTWQEAWIGFNSPEYGLYSFAIYDACADVEEQQKEEAKTEAVENMVDGKEFKNTNEAKRFLTKDMEFRKVSQELLFKKGDQETASVESEGASLLPAETTTQNMFETIKEIPEEMEFTVSDMELPKIERIIKKSKKLGTGVTATIVPDRIEKVELEYQTVEVQLHKVTLKRPMENAVQDHKIIGKITLTGLDENIVEPYWGVDFNFEQFKHCNVTCQHCNINRYRKVLYLVQNLKSGEVSTIGRSCLGDAFKVADIEGYIKYLEYCFELFKVGSELSMYGSGRDRFLADALEKEKELSFLKTEDCLAYIKKIIDRDGYVSRNASSSSNKDATADIMKNEFRDADIVSLGDKTSPELKKLITKDIEFYVENQDTSVEYNKMLVDMVKNKYVLKSKAYLLSGFFVSNDILKEKLKRDKQKSISQFIGEKGAKIETKAEFVRVVSFQNPFSYYDYINIYIFKDCEGNVFTWKTGKEMELTQGDKLNIQCTVKEHTVYDGEKQTVVIRLKIKN